MKTQIIPKGNNYTNWWQRRFMLAPKSFHVEIYLDKSLWYPYENEDSGDVNKLFGQSFGDHRNNSLRIGYVPDFNDDEIVFLYWYSTINGEDSKDDIPIGYFQLDQSIKFRFEKPYFKVISWNNGYLHQEEYKHPSTGGISYFGNPYYGFPNKAPHNITVKTKITNRRYF